MRHGAEKIISDTDCVASARQLKAFIYENFTSLSLSLNVFKRVGTWQCWG